MPNTSPIRWLYQQPAIQKPIEKDKTTRETEKQK